MPRPYIRIDEFVEVLLQAVVLLPDFPHSIQMISYMTISFSFHNIHYSNIPLADVMICTHLAVKECVS
jgi:hypothetical protein